MMTLKNLVENYALAKETLKNWPHDDSGLDEYLSHFRISSNAVYPFPHDGRRCFLRLAPMEEKLLTNIQGEIEFIQYLRKNGFPALEPIPSKSGEYVLTLDTEWGIYYASAFYGVVGVQIEDTDFSETICFASGKTLGKLHKLSAEYVPQVRKQTHEDILDDIEKHLLDSNCDSVLLQNLAALRNALSTLNRDKQHYGLVHYDFDCDNVFYDEETGVCNVIDFDDGIYHFYALDVERALASICKNAEESVQETAKSAFLSGYKTEFALDEGIENSFPVFRTFCDFYSYTRLTHCLSESVENQPDWMINLTTFLNGQITGLHQKLSGQCI